MCETGTPRTKEGKSKHVWNIRTGNEALQPYEQLPFLSPSNTTINLNVHV